MCFIPLSSLEPQAKANECWMLVADWGLVSACEGPPLRVLRRVLSTNPAEKGPDLGMMGARSVNRRHFLHFMMSFEAEAPFRPSPFLPFFPSFILTT